MKDCKQEWIKFEDVLPNLGSYIWLASPNEESVSCQFTKGMFLGPYTHWMPCERPAQPLPEKSPEELALEDHLSTHPLTTFEETWHTALRWERNRKK